MNTVEPSVDRKSLVLKIYNPIIRLLQIGGVTIGPTIQDRDSPEDGHLEDGGFKVGRWQWVYSTIAVLVLSTSTCGYFYRLVYLTPLTSPWVTVFMHLILNLTLNLLMMLSCLTYFRGSFQGFVNKCCAYEQTYGLSMTSIKLVVIVRIVIANCVLFGVSSIVGFICVHIYLEELGNEYFAFEKPAWINYVFICVEIWTLSTVVNGLILSITVSSMVICNELTVVVHKFKTFVTIEQTDVQKVSDKHITDTICRYDKLCTLVSVYSENCSYYVFIAFFVSMPTFCFTVYIILTANLSPYAGGLCYFLLFMCVIPSTVICLLGARVNVKAHEPLTYLWQISTSELSAQVMREFMLFSTRLTSTSIGYNLYGFFTISPPTVLTIIGTVVTYFVVVLQFKPSDSHACEDVLSSLTILMQDLRNSTLHST